MPTIKDKKFFDEPVDIDGNLFFRCQFTRCTLVYSGGEAPSFDTCVFEDAKFSFTGAAGRTLGLMQDLYHSVFREHMEKTFENIRQNKRQESSGPQEAQE